MFQRTTASSSLHCVAKMSQQKFIFFEAMLGLQNFIKINSHIK